MAWEEKYGGIWCLALRDGERVLSERFLLELDLITLVVKREDGNLCASVLRKGHDPQWRLPFWREADIPALVATLADAERYFEAWLGEHRPTSVPGR